MAQRMKLTAEQNRGARIDEGKIRELFELADADNSGALDKGEVKALAASLGKPGLSRSVLDAAWKDMDSDGSGDVDYEEFAAWWRKVMLVLLLLQLAVLLLVLLLLLLLLCSC